MFHRLFRETSPRFQEALVQFMGRMGHHSVLDRHTFRDPSTAEAQVQSAFIRVYSEYLSERLYLFQVMGSRDLFRLAEGAAHTPFQSMSAHDVLSKLPQVQSTLNKLILVVPEAQARIRWAARHFSPCLGWCCRSPDHASWWVLSVF